MDLEARCSPPVPAVKRWYSSASPANAQPPPANAQVQTMSTTVPLSCLTSFSICEKSEHRYTILSRHDILEQFLFSDWVKYLRDFCPRRMKLVWLLFR
ncbi:hypothetical protein L2E82_14232 [Cichorium intybus]|uniref:Uncharacterized protein n=1 Tax=Cichorium intybus TaxID=13427 RepID=A0ACB9EZG1_CICIN|nr:hypothetical protein L2E82_14232 [Cichorium intybus]